MFTGIVEELGSIAARDGRRLRIAASKVLEDVHLGDSIAVNGCCLTVVDWSARTDRHSDGSDEGTVRWRPEAPDSWWEADVTEETFVRTSLGDLVPGDPVNLERPVRLQDRLGGHLVQGHVDGVGTIIEPSPDLEIALDRELMRYVVEKGSITVDGVSLTVVEPRESSFTVALIPHTADVTTLGTKRSGETVNLELDVTAKYVEKLLAWHTGDASTTEQVPS